MEIEWDAIEQKLNQEAKVKVRELISEMGEEGQIMRLPDFYKRELWLGIELRESMLRYDRMSREGRPYVERGIMVENIAKLEKTLNRVKSDIKGVLYIPKPGEKDNKITEYMISKARDYPIDILLDTDKKIMLCPFHEEKTPSAHIWNNKLHCFGCSGTWDTLDILMKLRGLNFPDAVRRLQ